MGSYASIAPKLEPGKLNKWKKQMLWYLAGMELYYLKCIKDGPFQPKTADGHAKPESQWTPDERRVVVQDQRLKSIIMSCLSDNIIESVNSCISAKETWTDLVHSFEGPLDTKENKIMDLNLSIKLFRAKSTESRSQTYTRYKTLLNELANDGVNLCKHEINVGFVNGLLEKRLTFSQGLRNANHTLTLDLADIYGRFVYENNLSKEENSENKVDERSNEEYLRGLDVEYQERALLANSKRFIKRRNNFIVNNFSSVSKGFQPKLTPKIIQSSPNSNSQTNPKFQKDYKAEYKKMKAKLALLEASPPKVFDEEEATHVKVLMALADDELTVGKSHARNGGWVDITIRKVNTLFSMDEDADWKNNLKILVPESQAINESLETLNTPESSKDSKDEFLTLLPPLENLQGASPSSEVIPLTFQLHSPKERPGLGSFTYITDFTILEDIGEFILRDMAEVVMGKPFRKVTKLEYDYAKGLMSFTRIFDNYT
nr:hypothetical protein [Tanacetum cinerariifolium]